VFGPKVFLPPPGRGGFSFLTKGEWVLKAAGTILRGGDFSEWALKLRESAGGLNPFCKPLLEREIGG